nr:HNH endonuclease signature motif containing protein [Motilibacter deserti]
MDPESVSATGLADAIRTVQTWERRLAAFRARLVGEFEARGACLAEGALSPTAWLERELNLTRGEAHAARRAARVSRALPEVAAAFASGELTARQIDQLGHVVDRHGAGAVRQFEPELVSVGRTAPAKELGAVLRRVEHGLDPDRAREAELRRLAGRHLTLTRTGDGMWDVHGMLAPEDGEVLQSALLPLAGPVPQPDGSEDLRLSGERQLDALVELCRRALDRGDLPDLGGDKPHVTLVVDLATLRQESVWGGSSASALWGASLGRDALLRLCCDSSVSTVVSDGLAVGRLDPAALGALRDGQGRLSGLGLPLASGRTIRSVSPAQRRALVMRDGGCVFPACARSPGFSDAHHVVHWAHGGDTELANLASR